jgi:triphosphoribosyl-dephospho-CoA synthase
MNAPASGVTVATAASDIPSPSWPHAIAALAERSLLLEISTWPKPGLVSDIDNGSHTDMDAAMFRYSAAAIRPFFAELVEMGGRNSDISVLRKIGLRAERAMLKATQGVNTHRGAIFGLGLLCAAAGLRAAERANVTMPLGRLVRLRWGRDIAGGPRLPCSHGETAGHRYGAGGARQEAARGFPSVYEMALPALNNATRMTPKDDETSRVQACFAIIAVLEDTNLLHRGGTDGLRFAQLAAQSFLERGGVQQPNWLECAQATHREFVERRLSPGGAADILAMSLFVRELEPTGER